MAPKDIFSYLSDEDRASMTALEAEIDSNPEFDEKQKTQRKKGIAKRFMKVAKAAEEAALLAGPLLTEEQKAELASGIAAIVDELPEDIRSNPKEYPTKAAQAISKVRSRFIKIARTAEKTAAKAAQPAAELATFAGDRPEGAVRMVIRDIEAAADLVEISGWAAHIRRQGKLAFIDVRDGTGSIQVTCKDRELAALAATLPRESTVRAVGPVVPNDRSGALELVAVHLFVYARAASDLDQRLSAESGVDTLFDSRHLMLRGDRATLAMGVRDAVTQGLRLHFQKTHTREVTPPTLIQADCEGGSSLFSLDYYGENAFLTQSSQLYLETACPSFRDVFCILPSYRAERSRTRRHLAEFTHVECEFSWLTFEDLLDRLMHLIVDTVRFVTEDSRDAALVPKCRAAEREYHIRAALGRRIDAAWAEAAVELRAARGAGFSEARERQRFAAQYQRPDRVADPERRALIEKAIAEAEAEVDAMLPPAPVLKARLVRWTPELDVASLPEGVFIQMKHRQAIEWLIERGVICEATGKLYTYEDDVPERDERMLIDTIGHPVFLTHFPRRVKAFYMSAAEDQSNPDALGTDMEETESVDLLMPGVGEVIGGSMRIWQEDKLRQALTAADMSEEEYSWYMDLRKYGAFPHGGCGVGLERLVCWLAGLYHIRDACLYPRYMGRIKP